MVTGAWLISIEGDDLSKDGNVTVTLPKSVDRIRMQDANARVQSDLTFRVSARPASINVLRGRIENGVVITAPAAIAMKSTAYLQPLYEFRNARMRLNLRPDGNLDGTLGGSQPWQPIYWSHAKVGYVDERGFSVDTPGLYYALRGAADGYPDPKTGENTAISSAYLIQAVPALVARVDEERSTVDRQALPKSRNETDEAGVLSRMNFALFRVSDAESSAGPPLAAQLRCLTL